VRQGQVFANAATPSFAAPVLEIAQAQEDQPGRGWEKTLKIKNSTTGGFTS